MISENKFSKQAELDFMHNFSHDTEGDRWAKHEIETLRQQLAGKETEVLHLAGKVLLVEQQLAEFKHGQDAYQQLFNDEKAENIRLRQQVTLLRDAVREARTADDCGWCQGGEYITEVLDKALAATEPKP